MKYSQPHARWPFMRVLIASFLAMYAALGIAEANCPPEYELCRIDTKKHSQPTHNENMTLPLSCFRENGSMFDACDYFPAISQNGRFIITIESQGHALDREYFLRVFNTRSQRTKSHFLLFGYHPELGEKKPNISLKTLPRRLKKANRIIKRMKPEPMVNLSTSNEKFRVDVSSNDDGTKKILRVTKGATNVLEEEYLNEQADVLRVFYSESHNTLYREWGDKFNDQGLTIYRYARKSTKVKYAK